MGLRNRVLLQQRVIKAQSKVIASQETVIKKSYRIEELLIREIALLKEQIEFLEDCYPQ